MNIKETEGHTKMLKHGFKLIKEDFPYAYSYPECNLEVRIEVETEYWITHGEWTLPRNYVNEAHDWIEELMIELDLREEYIARSYPNDDRCSWGWGGDSE